jgi:hypothetical protein
MFKEDSGQIPTQKSWILSFRQDSLVMRPDAHQYQEASNSLMSTKYCIFGPLDLH